MLIGPFHRDQCPPKYPIGQLSGFLLPFYCHQVDLPSKPWRWQLFLFFLPGVWSHRCVPGSHWLHSSREHVQQGIRRTTGSPSQNARSRWVHFCSVIVLAKRECCPNVLAVFGLGKREETRMNSSMMRTVCSLTVSRSIRKKGRGVCPTPLDGYPPDADPPGCRLPPGCIEWHMLVKTLPCPKLRLRMVTRPDSSRMHTVRFLWPLIGAGSRSSSEQVRTGLHWWPPVVSNRGVGKSHV